jgi:hypothetical protein
MKLNWLHHLGITSKSYNCGYCGKSLASEKGYLGQDEAKNIRGSIYICHFCFKPTYFDHSKESQTPGPTFANNVNDISDKNVEALYLEARNSYSSNSFTAAVLVCRKLLMHIAVSKGAEENLSFIAYVEYLSNNNYIPPDAKDWVDHIRTKGNEANHEINIMKKEEAEDLIQFIEMLLKMIYEFPASIKRKKVD